MNQNNSLNEFKSTNSSKFNYTTNSSKANFKKRPFSSMHRINKLNIDKSDKKGNFEQNESNNFEKS